MKLIVGLGNPGEKYEKTRHNLGFMVVEHFLHEFASAGQTVWDDNKKLKSDIAQIDWEKKRPASAQGSGEAREKIILAKPKTYMNNSGMAVSLIAQFYKIPTEDIWIVHDELDLPMGTMKIRFGGAGAGHHGVESIINSLHTDKFWRFRLGIGVARNRDEIAHHAMHDVNDYVLGEFSRDQKSKTRELIKRAVHSLQTALESGMDAARNRFNTK